MKVKEFIRKRKILVYSVGIVAVSLSLSLIVDFYVDGKRSGFSNLAQIENEIREHTKKFEVKGLKTFIKRNPKGLVISVWEDNLFPISHWDPKKENFKFFTDLAKTVKKSNQNFEIKIISHYDSINPFGSGDDQVNKNLLTRKRAEKIVSALVKEGLQKERLSIEALGDKKPLVKDRDEYGMYLSNEGNFNRRLELFMAIQDEGVL